MAPDPVSNVTDTLLGGVAVGSGEIDALGMYAVAH